MKLQVLAWFFVVTSSLAALAQQPVQFDYGNQNEYEIAEIKISGIEYLDETALISISGLQVGDRIKVPGDDISKAISKLWNYGVIGNVQIYAHKVEGEKIYLTIALQERPRLRRFYFEGVGKGQERELRDQLKLVRGRILTQSSISSNKLAIERYFINKGFLNVDVKVRQQKDTVLKDRMNLIINIDKGDRVKIDQIIIEGNEAISDKKLKKRMKGTNEHPRVSIVKDLVGRLLRFNPKKIKEDTTTYTQKDLRAYLNRHVKLNFLNGSKLIKADFNDDKAMLEEFYNSKGYRDARVVSDSVFFTAKNKVSILLNIEEGRKYYFRNIDWVGNYVYSDETLQSILAIEKGSVYDRAELDKRLQYNPTGLDVTALYMDNGYLFFNVTPIERRVDGDSIDIEMRIIEGEQATINKVIVTGNDRTSDHVILRELQTLPGQKFSRSAIIRTQQLLGQLGYFDAEQIGINPIPNPADGSVDIEYSLVERPSDQIELSGGWGGPFGFVGTLGITFNNFSARNIFNPSMWRPLPVGDGQRLSLRAQANGPRFQSYSFSFSEPWFGGRKPNSFTFALTRTLQRNIDFITDQELGSFKVTSASLSLGRRLNWPDNYFQLSNTLQFSRYDINNFNSGIGFNTGIANNITLNTTIQRNSVTNPMFPKGGSTISLSASFTPPYSSFASRNITDLSSQERFKWVEYHKWMFDAQYYVSLAGDLVLNARAHMGFIGSYNSELGVGPFERFLVGGNGLAGANNFVLGTDIIGLRGYEDNALTPPYGSALQDQIRGGVVYNKFVMELRYPVSLNPQATIYILGFGEAGNNWGNFDEYNPFSLYRSAGFGARIFMPAFGLLGLDWAYGFDAIPGQGDVSGSQIHFTIGQQFR